ncbi:hypothetical protein [Caudoviricetes sp.]|nr:hypothetical protein [Caudoviricetes sp.]
MPFFFIGGYLSIGIGLFFFIGPFINSPIIILKVPRDITTPRI